MNNGQMDSGNENPTDHLLDDWEKPRKDLSEVGRPGIWTRDLPNVSLVRYHGATSLGKHSFFDILQLL